MTHAPLCDDGCVCVRVRVCVCVCVCVCVMCGCDVYYYRLRCSIRIFSILTLSLGNCWIKSLMASLRVNSSFSSVAERKVIHKSDRVTVTLRNDSTTNTHTHTHIHADTHTDTHRHTCVHTHAHQPVLRCDSTLSVELTGSINKATVEVISHYRLSNLLTASNNNNNNNNDIRKQVMYSQLLHTTPILLFPTTISSSLFFHLFSLPPLSSTLLLSPLPTHLK